MRTFDRQQLLQTLEADVRRIESVIREQLCGLPEKVLLQAPAAGKWSISQCLDHLNGYGHYYLPQLEAAINKGLQQKAIAPATFKSSLLGNYFANTMKPQDDGTLKTKMQAPKGHRPEAALDTTAVLTEALRQQQQLITLLDRAAKIDMQKLKVPISIAKWLKLSVGDTFRFLIAHEQRHLLQALRVKSTITGGKAITPAILLAI
ncbi:DinB family protein [Chitinophaga horti]|uniref:DinB family protein n=1 Tax=Chitinophaga horti TaxID=2920382 RepID=A0ABY6J058_9BACT|nr:DinB family protein [Chitinophaga horti]UYQ93048.1 DinB family protein [Chitinophaga horti]